MGGIIQNAVKNAPTKGKLSFSAYLTAAESVEQINKVVGKDSQRFISAIISATAVNPALQECANKSILSAALLGETLKLSPSPQLGHYYMVPYDTKEGKVAQFQLGYKGYTQLAIRSGQYKKLNVMSVKEGELEAFDPLNEEINIKMILDYNEREKAPTIGYYAFFELMNGFRKAIYWSREQMEAHALKYSPGYKKDKEKGWSYTFWSKDFDGMAHKTMLRQLISKWGIMSIEMQTAYDSDMAVISDDGKTYVESEEYVSEPDSAETIEFVDAEVNSDVI